MLSNDCPLITKREVDMNKRTQREIVSIYDYLIKIARSNLNNQDGVGMEWGVWKPTLDQLNVLTNRRDNLLTTTTSKEL